MIHTSERIRQHQEGVEFAERLSRSSKTALRGIITLCLFCLLSSGCDNGQTEISPEHRLGALFLSRSNIGDIKMFKDQSYIHGLSYFYFPLPAKDVNQVVRWLGVTERASIRPLLSDKVRAVSTHTDWKFKWADAKIYVAYYCHSFDGSYSSEDLLVVNDGEAVFVTEGYLMAGSYPTTDPSLCNVPAPGATLAPGR